MEASGAGAPTANYWWVNHKQTRQESDGECLWWPKKKRNDGRSQSYGNITRIAPGDVVFAFSGGWVRAVGVATGYAREAQAGWRLPVQFRQLERPLRPKHHAAELAPALPTKGVYLAAVPHERTAVLRRLLDGQLERVFEDIVSSSGPELTEMIAEEAIQRRADIGPAEKTALIKARRGQGIYRQNVELIEHRCRVTGLLDRRHLSAMHIKPWKDSTDVEKLDGFNGLLLSPQFGHLFDRGYISFSDSGDMLLSRELNPAVLKFWHMDAPKNVGAFRSEQARYLDFHRREVFERHAGGRRGAGKAPA